MMGIKEPRGKLVDSAGPEKSPGAVNRDQLFSQESPKTLAFPTHLCLVLTIHEAEVEHQVALAVRVEHRLVYFRKPVLRPAQDDAS